MDLRVETGLTQRIQQRFELRGGGTHRRQSKPDTPDARPHDGSGFFGVGSVGGACSDDFVGSVNLREGLGVAQPVGEGQNHSIGLHEGGCELRKMGYCVRLACENHRI